METIERVPVWQTPDGRVVDCAWRGPRRGPRAGAPVRSGPAALFSTEGIARVDRDDRRRSPALTREPIRWPEAPTPRTRAEEEEEEDEERPKAVMDAWPADATHLCRRGRRRSSFPSPRRSTRPIADGATSGRRPPTARRSPCGPPPRRGSSVGSRLPSTSQPRGPMALIMAGWGLGMAAVGRTAHGRCRGGRRRWSDGSGSTCLATERFARGRSTRRFTRPRKRSRATKSLHGTTTCVCRLCGRTTLARRRRLRPGLRRDQERPE